jgi:hypothetical protein
VQKALQGAGLAARGKRRGKHRRRRERRPLPKVSRSMIAAIEAKHKTGGVATLKNLAVALKIDLEHLA